MSVLTSYDLAQAASPGHRHALSRVFPACANPHCATGWLHLWRKRSVPAIEGGWVCSPACSRTRIMDLLRREQADWRPLLQHRHRVPIGLVLLNQGWITHSDLRNALQAQREGAALRLGEWLVANRGLDENRLTQALGLQWSCPVFSLAKHGGSAPVTIVPRLLSDSFGFVPLRLSPSGVLYLAFEDRIDHSLTLAIERMTGLRVESGLLSGSDFLEAHRRLQQTRFLRGRLVEAASLELLAESFTRLVEKSRPSDARLVRLHDLFWLRLWHRPRSAARNPAQETPCEDIIGSVVRFS